MSGYAKFTNWLSNTIKNIATVIFLFFFASLVLQVFFRKFIQKPLTWTEELAKLLNVWSVLLGSSIAVKYGTHIRVDMFDDRIEKLGVTTKKVFMIITNIIVPAIMSIVFLKGAYTMMLGEWAIEFTTLPIPQGILYMPLFIFSIIVMIFLVEGLVDILKEGGK